MRQHLVNLTRPLRRPSRENVLQIGIRIMAIQPRTLDQAHERCPLRNYPAKSQFLRPRAHGRIWLSGSQTRLTECTMKKIIFAVYAFILLGCMAAMFCYMGYRIAGTSKAAPEPAPAVSAKAVAYEYLVKTYFLIDDPVIAGDTATVNVLVMNQKCTLVMKRTKATDVTNRPGWLVTEQSCVAAN